MQAIDDIIFGIVKDVSEMPFVYKKMNTEINEWMYRKHLGLSYEEYLKEPAIKQVLALNIEDSINRRKADNG